MKPHHLTLLAVSLAVVAGCGHSLSSSTGEIPRANLASLKVEGETKVDKAITRAQGWIKLASNQPKGYRALGMALMQKGRETGDLDNYNAALTAFEKAVELDPKNSESLHGLAWAWTMFHRFAKAIELANQAIEVDPTDPFAYGVLVDSYVELGKYKQAEEAAQKMVDMRPDLASYSRVAQLRWILGDAKGAIVLMNRAVQAGGPYAENSAWCETQLGDMYWKTGSYLAAEQAYQRVLDRMPDYRHANFGMARIMLSKNKPLDAVDLMAKATRGNCPIPYVVEYGDLLASLGKKDEAEAQYDRVEKMVEEHLKHGIQGDEVALAEFYLEHDRKLGEALRLMEEEAKEHTSWQTYNALAWAQYKSKDYAGARKSMNKALACGIQDARLWHRSGMIDEALGKKDEARKQILAAETLHPHFDISRQSRPLGSDK